MYKVSFYFNMNFSTGKLKSKVFSRSKEAGMRRRRDVMDMFSGMLTTQFRGAKKAGALSDFAVVPDYEFNIEKIEVILYHEDKNVIDEFLRNAIEDWEGGRKGFRNKVASSGVGMLKASGLTFEHGEVEKYE